MIKDEKKETKDEDRVDKAAKEMVDRLKTDVKKKLIDDDLVSRESDDMEEEGELESD